MASANPMASIGASQGLASDARALDGLKRSARDNPEVALRQAARQFEAVFMRMLLSSMRASLPKQDLLASDATRMVGGMLDDQWAQSLSGQGRGLGLADLMMRQLDRKGASTQTPALLKKLQTANADVAPPAVNAAVAAAGAAIVPAANAANAAGASAPAGPQEFVRKMMGHAVKAQQASGIPAHFILGQAALESGWGQREIKGADGSASHNLFGIKPGRNWSGATVSTLTTEVIAGEPRKVVEKFRAYASYAEAFTDYARLLSQNPRYAEASSVAQSGGDGARFAASLQAAGYATDPAYASKLTRVINHTLNMQGLA